MPKFGNGNGNAEKTKDRKDHCVIKNCYLIFFPFSRESFYALGLHVITFYFFSFYNFSQNLQ
jgi:hypothetical protein